MANWTIEQSFIDPPPYPSPRRGRETLRHVSLRAFIAFTVLGLGTSTALAGAAREEVVRDFDKTAALPSGRSLRVTHQHGDVVVHTHALPEVRVHAKIRVSAETRGQAEELVGRIQIEVLEDAASVSVRTVYPELGMGRRNVSFSVDYDIAMPETAPLSVRNGFGNVAVAGLKSTADVVNAHGRFTVSDVKGDTRLENKFGAVEVSGIGGALSITNANGVVGVTGVGGVLTVRNRFGDITVRQARKPGTIVNGNGKVDVSESTGPLSITDPFGSVVVNALTGDLTVNHRNGTLEARAITGAAELNGSFGDIT